MSFVKIIITHKLSRNHFLIVNNLYNISVVRRKE